MMFASMVPTFFRITPLLGAAVVLASAVPAASAAPQDGGRPDQVFRVSSRGKVSKVLGVVTTNSLTEVTIERGDKENTYDSTEVIRVVWGAVPDSFRDGQVFTQRNDWESAVARFRVAAEDSEVREVLRADARLNAAEALYAWGATDRNMFAECIQECDTFLSTYSESRGVPRAEWLKARSTWLSGDPATAAGMFKDLHDKGAGGSPGYDRVMSLEAGLSAAHAYLQSDDTATARTLFTSLEGALNQAVNDMAAEDPALAGKLTRLAGEASVGEGFCMLAGAQVADAIQFFQGKQREGDSDGNSGKRFAATLGLGEAYAANGDLRKSQIELAKVSALEYSNPDRSARALLRLAEVTLQLGGTNATSQARTWINTLTGLYGGTPAAAGAAELLKKL